MSHGTTTGDGVPGEGAAQQAAAEGRDDAAVGIEKTPSERAAAVALLAAASGVSGLRRLFGREKGASRLAPMPTGLRPFSARMEPKRSKRGGGRS